MNYRAFCIRHANIQKSLSKVFNDVLACTCPVQDEVLLKRERELKAELKALIAANKEHECKRSWAHGGLV